MTGAQHRSPGWPLSLGFAGTGFGCALTGALLPVLLTAWRWDDRQAGRLFFVITAGSALGPLVLGRDLRRTVALGHLLIAAAAACWVLGGSPALLSGFGFGLGLGLAMTGISLLSRQRADAGAQGTALSRLNFLWAIGACCCPALVSHALRVSSPRGVLLSTAAVFVVFAAATLGGLRAADRQEKVPGTVPTRRSWSLAGIPVLLIAATALATGIEASGGAWLATYAQRSRHTFASTLAAPTLFWAGLLASRSLSWLPRSWLAAVRLGSAPVLRGLLVLVTLAAALLLLPGREGALLAGSFLLGFGLGPLYPELLARVLAHRETGTIFFLAGLASAVMPWATGALSTASGSLRTGFLVPLAGALILLVSGWWSASVPLRSPEPH